MAGEDRHFMGVEQFWEEYELNQVKENEFDVAQNDFDRLEIRSGGGADGFHFFFDTGRNRLIKSFLLKEAARTDKVCDVVLIKKPDDGYAPKLRFSIRDKAKVKVGGKGAKAAAEGIGPHTVKAYVDLGDCHENLWRLIGFLKEFQGIDLPPDAFRVADADHVQLLDALKGRDKGEILAAVTSHLEGQLTEREVRMLVNRREALERFEALLKDPAYAKSEMERLNKKPEALWQQFFEENRWIFGYGLKLISCEGYTSERLEQITTGANVFTGAGKRVDAAMRTRGAVRSLIFTEIKRPDADLLEEKPYRPPDVYLPTPELVGAVSQVQKTAHKAVRDLEDLHRQRTSGGEFQFEVSTIKPRQAVVIGNLSEFEDSGGNLNDQRMSSFELFRRDHHEVEIITFDELFERARFIVDSEDGAP